MDYVNKEVNLPDLIPDSPAASSVARSSSGDEAEEVSGKRLDNLELLALRNVFSPGTMLMPW
jgi:hypothetical protein